ncbi:hypothetical protein [Coxiella endosymbiont of Ornithodoros amblus]|uniref:hypothetical protein n=1 Tax=Coxiella endosymbiont of Ornithodoros amblus TaxID=1656166 RepID=UPI00244E3065|nr:hypothetical protein [Coxiella endosymbiont of Ornithodoros amblus]
MLLALNLSCWHWLQHLPLPARIYVEFFNIILIQMLLFKNRGRALYLWFPYAIRHAVSQLGMPLAVPLLLAGLILEKNTLTRFLPTRLMQLLGKAS